MGKKVRTLIEFRWWVKIQLLYKEISQRELGRRIGIPQARISEAIHGKRPGIKHIIPIIEALGGNKEDFNEFLKSISGGKEDEL